jgi:hypothetical protein
MTAAPGEDEPLTPPQSRGTPDALAMQHFRRWLQALRYTLN